MLPINELMLEMKKTIALIQSNKLSSFQSSLLMNGLIVEIIMNKEGLVQSNSELPTFVDEYILPFLEKNDSIPEYLFSGRPTLSGRINRRVFEELSYTQMIKLTEELEVLIDSSTNTEGKRTITKPDSQISVINSWSKVISKDNKKMISNNLFSQNNPFEVLITNASNEYQNFAFDLCKNEEYNKVIFKSIVALQAHITRIEVRSLYEENQFLENLFSGLLEAFHQFSMGYIKNVAFILRSTLEDFSKLLSLQITSKFDQNSFKKNKSKVEGYFNIDKENIPHYLNFNKDILMNYMGSLQNLYSVLSQTTHSLKLGITPISFLEDLVNISSDYLNPMYQYFLKFLNILHSIFIILSSDSFVKWDTYQLQNLLDVIFTNKNRDIWIRRIKENSIEEPTLFFIEGVNDNLLTKNEVTFGLR